MAKSNNSITIRTKMVKAFFRTTGTILLLLILLVIWYDQSRTFYCLSNENCITVWKRLGGKCYIVPNKYYGITEPSGTYIRTKNTQYLALYFSSDIPNKMIVRNQGSSIGEKGEYEIINKLSDSAKIAKFSDSYRAILYEPNAIKFSDVKESTEYLDLDIKENYATDKQGERIK